MRISAPDDVANGDTSPPSSPPLPLPPSPSPSPATPPRLPLAPSPSARKGPLQWLPLSKHPVFSSTSIAGDAALSEEIDGGSRSSNLLAWDASSSRLYLWDSAARCVHRLSLRFRDAATTSSDSSGDVVLEAAVPSEKLVADIQIDAEISHIYINVNGSCLLLVGSQKLILMYVYEKTSLPDQRACRAIPIASHIFSGPNIGLQILHVSWHPNSSSHLGILSSDSVFRLYDLSSDLEQPEQEYYLQPVNPGTQHCISICPVSFSFGGQHLWDRFSVFILFSDGSVFVLCPVVPFGSVCRREHIEEIYEDVNMFGLKSSDSKIVGNSHLAITWLEATFPEVAEGSSILVSKAHPYASIDASLSLQGPLVNVYFRKETKNSEVHDITCEGRAIRFLYSSVNKDSVFVIAWSSGQLQIDALVDEIQPFWNVGGSPYLHFDSHGRLKGVAMICESNTQETSTSRLNRPLYTSSNNSHVDRDSLGRQPPLLRLAIVDLSLPKTALEKCSLSLFPDPLVKERFYCLHGGGIDLISLQFLPFSNPNPDIEMARKAPSVCPVLTSHNSDPCSPILVGFVAISDLYGDSQIVCLSSSHECILLEMKAWNRLQPFQFETDDKSGSGTEIPIPQIISKELLSGPSAILVSSSTTLKSMPADTIEGRSTLHHYIKLFRENYVEYAHKVYVELKEHSSYLQTILNDQRKRLQQTKQLLSSIETKDATIVNRISRASKVYELLDQRLQNFRTLPAANRKPLTRAEREFKTELDSYTIIELDALHSSVRALSARLKRSRQTSSTGDLNASRQPPRNKSSVSASQMLQLKSSLENLSLLNKESLKKVKMIEDGLKNQEK